MESICTDNNALEHLAKSILVSLITEYETNYVDQGQSDRQFYAAHADLINKPNQKRVARFKRKRLLILTDNSLNKKDLQKAIEKLQGANPRADLRLCAAQVDIKNGNGINKIEPFSLLGTCDYSDIIIFITSKKAENEYLHHLIDIFKGKPFFYPHLVLRSGQKPTVANVAASLSKTLWFAHKTNDDSQSVLWKKYAFYDHLADLIRSQVSTANRTSALISVCQRYGLDDCGIEETNSKDSSQILVLGDSYVPVADLKKIIVEEGLDLQRFKFKLAYFDAAFSFELLRYNNKFVEVLVGPLPHSVRGKGHYSSGLALMEQNPDIYPRVIRMIANNQLKITQESFRQALKNTSHYAERHRIS